MPTGERWQTSGKKRAVEAKVKGVATTGKGLQASGNTGVEAANIGGMATTGEGCGGMTSMNRAVLR